MIGLDTNVLLRLVLRDDRSQYERVIRLIRSEIGPGRQAYVNVIVLVEFAWVLQRIYRRRPEDVLQALDMVLDLADVQVERHDTVTTALKLCISSGMEFSDALIAVLNRESGCDRTVTFDRGFAKSGQAALL